MAKLRISIIANKKTMASMLKLKIVVEKLQKSLLHIGNKSSSPKAKVPEDVKEGHFAVVAMVDDEMKRFVIPLSFLDHPFFLGLLEKAAEEFGFEHEGAVAVPCHPSELEWMLAEQSQVDQSESRIDAQWDSCGTVVESC